MLNFFWLIFAHSIGDMALQHYYIGHNKFYRPMVMIAHCFIWTGCIAVALQYLGILYIWKIIFLFIGHLISDYIASYNMRVRKVNFNVCNTYDQVWHFIQLVIVYAI